MCKVTKTGGMYYVTGYDAYLNKVADGRWNVRANNASACGVSRNLAIRVVAAELEMEYADLVSAMHRADEEVRPLPIKETGVVSFIDNGIRYYVEPMFGGVELHVSRSDSEGSLLGTPVALAQKLDPGNLRLIATLEKAREILK